MLKTWLLDKKPYAVFDAVDPKHRQAYYDFIQQGNWSNIPYRFVLEEMYTDLPSSINQKLTAYYMAQEFKKTTTKVLTKKPLKLVD